MQKRKQQNGFQTCAVPIGLTQFALLIMRCEIVIKITLFHAIKLIALVGTDRTFLRVNINSISQK